MENVYEKLKRMVEAMGMKGVENYYQDPASAQPAEESQDDPMAAERAKADAEIEKVRIKALADIEIARINNETKLKIAGMEVPPELQALLDAFSAPQTPQGAPPGPPQPPEEPEPAPEPYEPVNEPIPQGEDMNMGMMPPEMPQ
jgi:hypothetical protein